MRVSSPRAVQGELRQVLAELELVSQVSAVNLDPTARDTSESIGGNRPSGGINRKDDRQPDYPQKSVEHFRRRAAGARSEYQLGLILKDAKKALEACKRQAAPADPLWMSFEWKRQIAREVETRQRTVDNARVFYAISKRTVYRYLAAYGSAERKAREAA